jgi:hypothetical protein
MNQNPKIKYTLRPGDLFALSCILTVSTMIFTGCKKNEFESQWRDREISIDGDHTDWKNSLTYVEDKNISIGLLNDEEFLYVCLVPGDFQIQNQMMRLGFTLWLDPEGGKDKTLGIHYPLGMMNSGLLMTELGFGSGRGMSEPDPERMRTLVERSLSDLEILGPDKDDVRRMGVDQAEGLRVEVGNRTGTFVYELKVPLVVDEHYLYGIDAVEGSTLGVGFETTEIDREKMRQEMGERGGGMRGGGMRGGGMRGGGRMGGGMRGGGVRPGMAKPLKVWTKVILAPDSNTVSF